MNNYQNDKEFLDKYLNIIELSDGEKKVLVTPDYQGRVMTSSAAGDEGYSFGWINYDLIASQTVLPHCNNWGGEDRFWLGPEGGQYAIFFAPDTPKSFDFEHWQAPAVIDTKAWEVVEATSQSAKFVTTEELQNWSGSKLCVKLEREVRLLNNEQTLSTVGVEIPQGVEVVGFESSNVVTNIGEQSWTAESGALSVWILGQFKPSEDNNIIIPTKSSEQATMNSSYFGQIEESRLSRKSNIYYFKGDGNKRGKLGTPPQITIPVVFALDKENGILTVVKFSFESEATQYINSMWEYQSEPYKGDVINSYNDGPLEDGTIMGGFYEIETSSKALFLSPSQSHNHTSTTIHIKGDVATLEGILSEMIKGY